MKKLLLFCIAMLTSNLTYAVREPKSTPGDNRIKTIVYNANEVYKFTGHYDYQSWIEFGKDEKIVSIYAGDSTGWQIVPTPEGNSLFLKPVEENATTNLTLTTDKHIYLFELHAQTTTDIADPQLVFHLKFLYPDDDNQERIKSFSSTNRNTTPNLDTPELYNFHYYISGNEEIAPIKIYDDGEFTFLQFRDKNKEIPAIFAVDEDLRESMINSRLDPNHPNLIIVEHVFRKMTLRLGKKVTCVYNEAHKS